MSKSNTNTKNKLLEKLKKVKSNLETIKNAISSSTSQKSDVIKKYKNFINSNKENFTSLVNNIAKQKNQDFYSIRYWKIIKNVRDLKQFIKSLYDVLSNSIDIYNLFLLIKLPYYKDLAIIFMINEKEKLFNNHIFSKLTTTQINKIYNEIEELDNKKLLSYINYKYPVNIIYDKSRCYSYYSQSLDSISQYGLNQVEFNNINDEDFKYCFEKEYKFDRNNLCIKEIVFNNCQLKKVQLSQIQYKINHLKFINSNISSTIFDSIQFSNLITLILDNNNLHSDAFEKIFKNLFNKECQIYNNLKIISAKNNFISRIIRNEEIARLNNKLNNLEIFNLSNNNIYDVKKEIFQLIPNLKLFDLSNNNINNEKICKDIINNCQCLVILLNNIGIMKKSMNKYYQQEYFKKLVTNDYPLYSLNMNSLFYERNFKSILTVDLSNIKNNTNIKEINLSSCYINDETLIKLLTNCTDINNNISKINLSNNNLTKGIFSLFVEKHFHILFDKLTELDLSFNPIKIEDTTSVDIFINFLNNFNQLEKISLIETSFQYKLNEYIKEEINLYYKLKRNMKVTPLNKLNSYINQIFSKNLILNKNLRIIIYSNLSSKYTNKINKIKNFQQYVEIPIDYGPEEKKNNQ